MAKEQAWELETEEHHHRVVTRDAGFSRVTTWSVDGEPVVEKKSSDDTLVLTPDGDRASTLGALRIRFTMLGSARRVTWFEGDDTAAARAHTGIGGLDLDPEPGSPGSIREERARARPRLYAARHVAAGVAKVAVPLLLAYLAARLAFAIPWPDWDLPWPDVDLPAIPWPDLPSLPWPEWNLPDWQLPDWLRWLLDKVKYVWPIVLGVVLARGEINRRRKQDRLKSELRAKRPPIRPPGRTPTRTTRPRTGGAANLSHGQAPGAR